ncbi:MAG TPA: site-specific integrase, partial [Acidobacteriaceae bacterium]|nr:site-specific integrase [Acidobacteriaceae bacterium]
MSSSTRRCRATFCSSGYVPGTHANRAYLLVPRGYTGIDGGHRKGGRRGDRQGGRMTTIAPLITAFLREHLPVERGYSPNTCETYAHAFRLLFAYISDRLGMRPSQLCLEHVSADMVLDFLAHIERGRHNGAATRNARLAAIKAFMRYVEFRVPSALQQTRQILAIPGKRHEQMLVQHLTMNQIRAILNSPNLAIRSGVRDRAMLHLCFACGLRVSELVSLP